jgi:hypothetical protein
MADESYWVERAQSAEAKLQTVQEAAERLKERVRSVKDTLGARERSDGSFEIDFGKLVTNLGVDNALEIRRIIDEQYGISGNPGEKPRMKARAA